jgi:thiol-disulfide isomerase/thioredoxin
MKRITVWLIILVLVPVFGFPRGKSPEASGMEGSEMEPETVMMMEEERENGLLDFTDLETARMVAEKGPAVLFFYADWCPLCRADLEELRSNTAKLDGVTVIVVDYDEENDLKKKYGITYQHTYVQIDTDGERLAIWNGGGISGILENVSRGEM